MMAKVLFFFLLFRVLSADFTFSGSRVTEDERYVAGKEQYEMLQKETRAPRYSACWLSALDGLESGCRELSEDVQHHLAIGFTNCFLMKTGREVYPCVVGQDISECTKPMTSDAYNTYTTFFTHTQNICYFLLAQVWQSATEKTIDSLKDTSDTVVQQMENTSSRLSEMTKNQDKLIVSGKQLHTTIQESAVDVHKMLNDFKVATDEQKSMIFEVFDRVNSLQATLLGEITGFYSMIFYVVSIVICYLVTSTPRSSGARFWLFCLMTMNMISERVIVSAGSYSEDDEMVYARLWICRRVYSFIALFLWTYMAYVYQDMNQINNKLLNDIQVQNKEVKSLLENKDSDSDCSSSESGISDHTYKAEEKDDSDSDSFTTTDSGRFTMVEHSSLLDELRDIRQATPNRQMNSLKEILSPISPVASLSGSGRKPRNKRVWPVTRSYNLRSRSNEAAKNPTIDKETEQEFSKKVKEMARISAKNSQKVRATFLHQLNRGPFFSSDED